MATEQFIKKYVDNNPFVPILKERGEDQDPNALTVPPQKPVETPQKHSKPTRKQPKTIQTHTTPPPPTKAEYLGDLASLKSITRLHKRLLKDIDHTNKETAELELAKIRAKAYIIQNQIRLLSILKPTAPTTLILQQGVTPLEPSNLKSLTSDEQLQLARAVKKLGW